MLWSRLLTVIKQGGTQAVKALPKLWPLLLDAKTRAAITGALRDIASRSPTRRLRGRVDGTVAVASGIAAEASDPGDKELAESWVRRGRNLSRTLDIPAAGRRASAAKRHDVAAQLAGLQREMQEYLERPAHPDPDRGSDQ
jgi:uncharacterized membrane protein YccC